MSRPKVQRRPAAERLAEVREERRMGRIVVPIYQLEEALDHLDRAERTLRLIRTEALTQSAAHLLEAENIEERDRKQEPIVVGKRRFGPHLSREFYVEKAAQATLDDFVKTLDAIVKSAEVTLYRPVIDDQERALNAIGYTKVPPSQQK